MPLALTPITADDYDAWLPLWSGYLEFYESELSVAQTESSFRRLVADEVLHGALARDAHGTVIGFTHWLTHAATWSDAPYCYLEDLFVSPDARGAGAGEALIEHVHEWARAHGCAKVYWLTQEHNATARRLYDRVATSTGFVHYQR